MCDGLVVAMQTEEKAAHDPVRDFLDSCLRESSQSFAVGSWMLRAASARIRSRSVMWTTVVLWPWPRRAAMLAISLRGVNLYPPVTRRAQCPRPPPAARDLFSVYLNDWKAELLERRIETGMEI